MKIITKASQVEESPLYAIAEKVMSDRKAASDKAALKTAAQTKLISDTMAQRPEAAKVEARPSPVVLSTPAKIIATPVAEKK